ncbi:hypothetical protein [uncultured Amphritea sp.]|uniref:hypothetical protein n=1 Tax=uncultured Amphritea sp. TaxID=981605 RepID=UPI002633E70F|nr:hypothetical protein [uncultured Amphritea sp.]
MPSSKEDRLAIYQGCYEELGLESAELARLLNLGELTRSHRHKVDDKVNGREGRGITKTEALLMQVLCELAKQGVKLETIQFDETGRITHFPKS